jgi:adenylyltransferase/sulfurtransferase
MTENDYRLINLRYSCPLLRQEDVAAGRVPTSPTISSMIGGMQTQEALKVIHGLPVAGGEAIVFNGVANQLYRTRYQRRDDCLSHDTYTDIVELPLCAHQHTAAQLLEAARPHLDDGPLQLELDRDLVTSVVCNACETASPVMKPIPLVSTGRARCPNCGEMARPEFVHAVGFEDELAGATLSALGVPSYDIVRVAGQQTEGAFALAGDGSRVLDL